jgi:hypothetical protein
MVWGMAWLLLGNVEGIDIVRIGIALNDRRQAFSSVAVRFAARARGGIWKNQTRRWVSKRRCTRASPKHKDPYVPRCEYGDGARTAELGPEGWLRGHSGGCNGGHAPGGGERPGWPGDIGCGEPVGAGSAAPSVTARSIPIAGAAPAPDVDPDAPGVDTRRAGSRPVGPLPRGCLSLGGRASICLSRAFSVSRTSIRSSSAERCCLRRARNALWTSRAREGGRLSLRFRPREDMVGGGLAPASEDGGVGLLEILTEMSGERFKYATQ